MNNFLNNCKGLLILGDPGSISWGGKESNRARKKFGQRKVKKAKKIALLQPLDFSLPEFFSRPFKLFPAPTNCPCVPEDGGYCFYRMNSVCERLVRFSVHSCLGEASVPLSRRGLGNEE